MKIFRSSFVLGGFLVAFFFSVVFSIRVYALPKYSLQEKKRCHECHYNKKGGGPLNGKGKFYSQNRTLTGYLATVAKVSAEKKKEGIKPVTKKAREEVKVEEKKKPIEEEMAPSPERFAPSKVVIERKEATLLDRTHLSASLLLSYLLSEDSSGPNSFYFMRAEPMVTTQVTKSFQTVFGYNFAAPLLTAYGQFNIEDFYIQIGSFHLPFGIDTFDYNNITSTLVKEHYDLTLDTRDIGFEMGYEKDWFLRGAVINGAREPRERPTLLPSFDRHLGYVINGGYQGIAFQVPFLLGASVLYENRVPPGDVVRGRPPRPLTTVRKRTAILNVYGELDYGGFSLLGESTYGLQTPHAGDRSFGFYLRPSYNVRDDWNVAVRGEIFARDRLFLSDSFWRLVFSSEYHFSKYASIEPILRLNYEAGVVKDVHDHEFITLVHMQF